MNKNQIKGVATKVVGKAQRKAGEAVGSTRLQAKGFVKELVGAFQTGYGDGQQKAVAKRAAEVKAARRKPASKQKRGTRGT